MITATQLKPLKPVDQARWRVLVDRDDRFAVWDSEDFIVQAFHIPDYPGVIRLSTNRRKCISGPKLFADGITWDDLQAIKRDCGYGDRMAVEIYPADQHIINAINARHLWLLPKPLAFAWTLNPIKDKQ